MRLYKITSPTHDFGDGDVVKAVISWQGTQSEARKKRIALEEPFKGIKPKTRPTVEVEEIDVPTNKEALLGWLNENAV